MKHYPGMVVATAFVFAIHTTATAQPQESVTWTTHECTPRYGTSGFSKMTMKKMTWNLDIQPGSPLATMGDVQGFSWLNVDGIEGTGAYKVSGLEELYGAIINGMNYVAFKTGAKVRLYTSGDPLNPKLEDFALVETFDCKETESRTRHIPKAN